MLTATVPVPRHHISSVFDRYSLSNAIHVNAHKLGLIRHTYTRVSQVLPARSINWNERLSLFSNVIVSNQSLLRMTISSDVHVKVASTNPVVAIPTGGEYSMDALGFVLSIVNMAQVLSPSVSYTVNLYIHSPVMSAQL
ncbi:TPA: hypothetical protein DCZ39_00035 [Patescibacteria group bacterium]|nr:hypothetical protein [Candidatus Gracilibacteria bacterium]